MIDVFGCITLNFLSLQRLDENASPLLRTSQDERQNRIEGRTRHCMSIVALNGFAAISLRSPLFLTVVSLAIIKLLFLLLKTILPFKPKKKSLNEKPYFKGKEKAKSYAKNIAER